MAFKTEIYYEINVFTTTLFNLANQKFFILDLKTQNAAVLLNLIMSIIIILFDSCAYVNTVI